MATMKFNPLVDEASGRYGKLVLRRQHGKIVLAYPPAQRSGPVAPALARAREVFREAAAYSKGVFDRPARRAPYNDIAARENRKDVYPIIMRDFLKLPVIQEIVTAGYHGKVGDPIVVKTRHDLAIALVHVVLRRADGSAIEEGDAAVEYQAFRYLAAEAVPAGTAVVAEVTVTDNDNLEVTRKVPLVVA